MLRGPVMSLRVIRSCKAGFQAVRASPALPVFGAHPSDQPRLCRSAFLFMRTACGTCAFPTIITLALGPSRPDLEPPPPPPQTAPCPSSSALPSMRLSAPWVTPCLCPRPPRPADCTVPKHLSAAINASINSLGDTLSLPPPPSPRRLHRAQAAQLRPQCVYQLPG